MLEQLLQQGGQLHRHPWSRLAWRRASRGATLFCSGLALPVSITDARRLCQLEALDLASWEKLSAKGRDAVFELTAAGHYQPGNDED